MDTKELHAYIRGPDFTAVTQWIETVLTDLQRKETIDLTTEIGRVMLRFDYPHDELTLEQVVGTGWLELSVRLKKDASIFDGWNDIQFGERLVDDLGGITLVDCGGVYTHPLSDAIVRISPDKMELVVLPETFDDPFDERLTQLIKKR